MKGLESKLVIGLVGIVLVIALLAIAIYIMLTGADPFRDFLQANSPQSVVGKIGGG